MSHDTEKLHGPVFGTAHTVAEVMENARRRAMRQEVNSAGNIYCDYCHTWHQPGGHAVMSRTGLAEKTQRIRDLERENEELGKEITEKDWATLAASDRERDLLREVGERDQNLQLARAVIRDLNAKNSSLEREVERLRGLYDALAIVDENDMTEQQRADRADAERFRWLIDKYWDVTALEHNQIETGTFAHTFDWEGYSVSPSSDIRALIDADRAKEGCDG